MNKTRKFAITLTWILLSRSYDAYCTYKLTPDLSRETNPLVTVAGISSWMPLLIILSVLTVYIIYAYYISVYKPFNLLPTEKGYSFGNVVAYSFLGVKANWTAIFYRFPKDLNRFNHYMGHLLTRGLAYAGVVSTVMWLLINYTSWYYKTIHGVVLIYSVLIIGYAIISFMWHRSQYKQYLLNTGSSKP